MKRRRLFSISTAKTRSRKDIACWDEVRDYVKYFYSELYTPDYTLPEHIDKTSAKEILAKYKDIYSEADDKDTWFSKIKELCVSCGYTPNVKEYKKNPDAYKGHVGDVTAVIRIAMTSRTNTPDLYYIMQILGTDEVMKRIDKTIEEV